MKVFVDGSCVGSKIRKSGAGLWVPATKKAYCCNVPGEQTNNRAELTAIILALTLFPEEKLLIHSDSEYTINSLTVWYKNWQKNGWKNAKGKPVENQDLIQTCLELQKDMDVEYLHVRAHQKDGSYETTNNNIVDLISKAESQSTPYPGLERLDLELDPEL